jgi:DNA-directed RNA polymerase alpha subunit
MKRRVTFPGSYCGVVNALRRVIVSERESWAPYQVVIERNTSGHTDEYLAHRIGLIPFRKEEREADGDGLRLDQTGGLVCARDLEGSGFVAVHGNIPIVSLGKNSELKLNVVFDKRNGRSHARYCSLSAVSIQRRDEDFSLLFETHDPLVSTSLVVDKGIELLCEKVEDMLRQLDDQPKVAPTSMC